MGVHQKLTGGAVVLLLAASLLPGGGGAVTLEVAKKCNGLLAKEFPPRQSGNPAAGSAKGNAQAQRDYYKKCVDNGGNVEATADKNTK